jgi:bifunctional DNA-binding transcriptional regulator/antitoxin component of YhaV-PrlF toxin-antitoxin module
MRGRAGGAGLAVPLVKVKEKYQVTLPASVR